MNLLLFGSYLELGVDFKMPRQAAVRLHEQCPLIHNEASRGTLWWQPKLFAPRWCTSSWPAAFSGADVFWHHLANLIDDSVASSPGKEAIKVSVVSCGSLCLLGSFSSDPQSACPSQPARPGGRGGEGQAALGRECDRVSSNLVPSALFLHPSRKKRERALEMSLE